MLITIHPAAVTDLSAAADFYKAQASQELAVALVSEFERTVQLVATHPELGVEWVAKTKRIVLRRFPFNLVYRLNSDTLTVIAFAHQRRKPNYWTSRK